MGPASSHRGRGSTVCGRAGADRGPAADTLILPIGGERTAELVPAANLLLCNDMGHDLPEPLWPLIADTIASHARNGLGGF